MPRLLKPAARFAASLSLPEVVRLGSDDMHSLPGRCYGAALAKMGNPEEQEVGRWLNNKVENTHLPFRRRERAMLRFDR